MTANIMYVFRLLLVNLFYFSQILLVENIISKNPTGMFAS